MKIKDVNFPPALLDALQDGRLVVFAGAVPLPLSSISPFPRKLESTHQSVIKKPGCAGMSGECGGETVETVRRWNSVRRWNMDSRLRRNDGHDTRTTGMRQA